MDSVTIIGTIAGLVVGFLLSLLVIVVFQARTGGIKSISLKGMTFFQKRSDAKANPHLFWLGISLERVKSAIREDDEFLYEKALEESVKYLKLLDFSKPREKINKLEKGIGVGISPIRANKKLKNHALGEIGEVENFVAGAIKTNND